MGIWIELGVFAIALAFGLWQIHDVKKPAKPHAGSASGSVKLKNGSRSPGTEALLAFRSRVLSKSSEQHG